jgi:hypothetical protein
MAIGALSVIVPLEGGRYLIERQRTRAAAALIQPGPELLAPLLGWSYDGVPLATVVTPTADNPTPLERRHACLWGVPGRNPYKGSPRQVLTGANLPPDVVRKLDTMIERRRVSGRVEISNGGIWSENGRRHFDPKVTAMGFGKTLCFNTRVNFPAGHVEVADLYEATDDSGAKYAVMVPYVCGNVAVLAERAERAESPPVYTSVPEPGTWASLLAGLGAMAWVMRRRRRKGRGADDTHVAAKDVPFHAAILLLVAGLALSTTVACAAPPATPSVYAAPPGVTLSATDVTSLRAAAARGEMSAQYDLGVALACGNGVARNRADAARWFRKSAEQGHVQAQSVLGWMYMSGSGVRRDDAQALRWLRRAADRGDTAAQNNLGIVYAQGRGVPANPAEAERWFRRAAEQGAADAARNLDILLRGEGRTVRPSPDPPHVTS